VGGFIVFTDGRAYSATNWAYDAVIEAIVQVLPDTDEAKALADWLLNQRSCVLGPGMGRVDLLELTPMNQSLLLQAIQFAYCNEKERGPEGWTNPESWPPWIQRFSDLVKMIESMQRGESPDQFNPHMRGVSRATGRRSGPGWDIVSGGAQ